MAAVTKNLVTTAKAMTGDGGQVPSPLSSQDPPGGVGDGDTRKRLSLCTHAKRAASVFAGLVRQGRAGTNRGCADLCADVRIGTERSPVTEHNLSEQQSHLIANRIREELARRRMSRRGLADLAKISISTLEKVLSGRRPFTLATTIRIEGALGVNLRTGVTPPPAPVPATGLAPGELGYYSRPSVSWLEGIYVTLRPSFSEPSAIYAYRTEILWDQEDSRLVFRESERIDAAFSQAGAVAVPNQSGFIYFITNRNGQYRLVILSRPTISGEMHGVMTTLMSGRGSHLTPVAAPVVLVPPTALGEPRFGVIPASDACHAVYRRYLKRTIEEPFALFLQV
jgi:transcriptional regulator with XRE-family HTH domain